MEKPTSFYGPEYLARPNLLHDPAPLLIPHGPLHSLPLFFCFGHFMWACPVILPPRVAALFP
jgi:hypothetical protein